MTEATVTDALEAALREAGLDPVREGSAVMRSPYAYLTVYVPDGRRIVFSDGAENGEDGRIFVSRYLSEDDEGGVSAFENIEDAVAFGKGLL